MEPVDKDIERLNSLNGQLLIEIAAETTSRLNENQLLLSQCKWTDGESNTDTDFSKLACKCAEEAWLIVKQKYIELKLITMTTLIPDINCIFQKIK